MFSVLFKPDILMLIFKLLLPSAWSPPFHDRSFGRFSGTGAEI
ncbi:protein of unknown function [Agrobacterium pusense]|uniref:Uncharacterized protein n=1 Tax=Agrobacterium pusense TaxID=648995 RepID=U4QD10_9HYPH|nr:protein of unknown function [Agrobacterium pusense]